MQFYPTQCQPLVSQIAFDMHVVNEEVGLEDEEEKAIIELKTSVLQPGTNQVPPAMKTSILSSQNVCSNEMASSGGCMESGSDANAEGGAHFAQQLDNETGQHVRVVSVRILVQSGEPFKTEIIKSIGRLRDTTFYKSII